MLAPLTACSTAPTSITEQDIARAAPDVMSMPVEIQREAAAEMSSGACPALNQVADLALVTIDEARAEK